MDPRLKLRRTVCVEVRNEDDIFGQASLWRAEIARWCDENHSCELVWHDGEADEAQADMRVEVTILPGEASKSRVDSQGAVLDFLAWSTLPLVPLWIEDVKVTPALDVQVRCFLRVCHSEDARGVYEWEVLPTPKDAVSGIEVSTCMRERYPLGSWSTLGAVFVPPFLFKEGDPERLQEAIAGKVRYEAARRIGPLIRESQWTEGELLRDLVVEERSDGLHFACRAAPAVGAIRFCVGPRGLTGDTDGTKSWREVVNPDRTLEEWGCAIPDSPGIRGRLLRVEAVDRLGRRLPYSISIPPSTFVADAEVES